MTLGELQDRLHRSIQANPQIDPLALTFALADLGATVQDNSIATSGNRPVFTIATALFTALRDVQRPYPFLATEATPFVVQPEPAAVLVARADGVMSDEYVAQHRAGESADPVWRARELRLNMIWTLAENGIFQGEMMSRLGCALVLTGLAGFRGLAQRWPLVQLNEDQFLVPAHPFLKVQLSSKFLTKALAFARLEAPLGLIRSGGHRAKGGYGVDHGGRQGQEGAPAAA